VALVNPRPTRDVAKATGQLAKTDHLDAQAVAPFARAIQPQARPVPPPAAQVRAAPRARRRHLLAMLTMEQTRLRTALPAVRAHLEAPSAWLTAALDDLDGHLARQIAADPAWQARVDRLRSAPGVGRVRSMTLVADLPALGVVHRRQIAKRVGVAPRTDDSGTRRGKRPTWGGRATVRSTRSMATLSAIRFNPVSRVFSQRLQANGTPKPVALVAGMRTRLTLLNARLGQGTCWQPAAPSAPLAGWTGREDRPSRQPTGGDQPPVLTCPHCCS
jgi:transposase